MATRQTALNLHWFLALFLSLTLAVPYPAFALHQTEPKENAGLEQELRTALNSDDPAGNLIKVGKNRFARLTAAPEPQPAAGLEEDSEEKNILKAVPALLSRVPAVRKSAEIDQERTRRIARSLRDFFRGHRSITEMPRGVSDLLIAQRPQGESGPSDYVAVWLFQAVTSYLDDPDSQVRADMQETLALLVKIVKLQLAGPRSKMQEGIERTLENLKGHTQEPEVRVAAYRAFWAFLGYGLLPSPLQILEVSESAMLDLQHKNPRVREAAVNTVHTLLFETITSRGDGVRRVEMEEVEKFIPLLKDLQDDPDDKVRKSVNETLRSFDNVREFRRKAMIDQWSKLVTSAEGFSGSTSVGHLIRAQLLLHGATTSSPSATAPESANVPAVVSPAPQVSLSSDASEDQLVIESNYFSDLEGQLRIVETKDQLTISGPSGEPLRIQSGVASRIQRIRYDPAAAQLTLYLDPSTGVKAQKIGRLAVRESSDGPDYLLTLWIDIAASTAAGLEEQDEKFARLRKELVNEQGRARVIEEGPMEGYVRLIPDSLIKRQMGLLPKAMLNFLSLSPERAILRNLNEFRVGGAFYTQAVIGGPVVDNIERPITVLLVLDLPAELVATYQTAMKAMDEYSPGEHDPTKALEFYHRDSLLTNAGGALWEFLPEPLQAQYHGIYPTKGPIYQRMMNRIQTSSVTVETPFGRQQTSRTQGITDLDGEIFAATFSWHLDSESIWKELGQPPLTDLEHRYFEKILRWVETQAKDWKPLPGTPLFPPAGGLEGVPQFDAASFKELFPDQAENVPAQASHILFISDPVTFYRPETLASGLEQVIQAQQADLSGLPIDQLPIPTSVVEVRSLSVFVWDPMLGDLPYQPRAPVVEYQLGQPFPYTVLQLVQIAVLGRLDASTVAVLAKWSFEYKGRQVTALAVLA